MASANLAPATEFVHLDSSARLSTHRQANRFFILRAEVSEPLEGAVHKSSQVPSLLVSTSLRPAGPHNYRLWVDEKRVPIGEIPAFRSNVLDLAAVPTIWAGPGYDYLHFYLRRSVTEMVATDLGFAHVGEFRAVVGAEDLVLSQMARTVAPTLATAVGPSALALDQLEQILAAHIVQHYGARLRKRGAAVGGLAAWQSRRATELLAEHLDGRLRLEDLARECDLSASHFARAFKVSFGVTSHQWLIARRIDRAKELLVLGRIPLAEIGSQSGFGDQAAFTRTFHRVVGMTPGRWRREHGGGRYSL